MASGMAGRSISITVLSTTGSTDWVLQYVGRIRDFQDITDSFTGKHQAKIVSNLLIHEILETMIGAPATDGTRQPFMAGYYKCRAELKESVDPCAGPVTKTGTGSCYPGGYRRGLIILRISVSWSRRRIPGRSVRPASDGVWTAAIPGKRPVLPPCTSIAPIPAAKWRLHLFCARGRRLTWWAGIVLLSPRYSRRIKFVIAGAPFLEISNVYLNGVEVFDTNPNITTGELNIVGSSGFVDARVIKSATYNPIDIIRRNINVCGISRLYRHRFLC